MIELRFDQVLEFLVRFKKFEFKICLLIDNNWYEIYLLAFK